MEPSQNPKNSENSASTAPAGAWQASDGFFYSADSTQRWNGHRWEPVYPTGRKKGNNTGKVIAGVAAGIVVICVLGVCGSLISIGDDDDEKGDTRTKRNSQPTNQKSTDQNSQNNSETLPEEIKVTGLNTAVRDGKFEFVVSNISCGEKQVGGEYLSTEAQGQFCFVDLTVKNISDVPQTFSGSNQYAYGSGNAKYTNDTTAEIYANEDNQTFFEEINPGNTLNARVVFDIPQDQSINKLELHDSAFSGGVTVQVS